MTEVDKVVKIKEFGDNSFKKLDFFDAIKYYSEAIGCLDYAKNKIIYINLLNNRCFAYLKYGSFKEAIDDADKVIQLDSSNLKALYRRSLAHEKLENYEQAYIDAKKVFQIDSKNEDIMKILERLTILLKSKKISMDSSSEKFKSMMKIINDASSSSSTIVDALNNLVALSKDSALAEMMYAECSPLFLQRFIFQKSENRNQDQTVAAFRIIQNYCTCSREKTLDLLKTIPPEKLIQLIAHCEEYFFATIERLLQIILSSLVSIDFEKGTPANEDLCTKNKDFLDTVYSSLLKIIISPTTSVYGRQIALNIIIQSVTETRGVNWTKRILRIFDAVSKLCLLSSQHPSISSWSLSADISVHTALALQTIYDDLCSDSDRKLYRTQVNDFINPLLENASRENSIKLATCLSVLFKGPIDVANSVVGTSLNIFDHLLKMASSEDQTLQMVAADAIINSATDKSRCANIIKDGVPILKKLYKSSNEEVKARGLLGLCKAASALAYDLESQPFEEDSTIILSKACQKILADGKRSITSKNMAIEGLSYLTLNAEIKEFLLQDASSIPEIIKVSKMGTEVILISAVTIFVNLSNSYDKAKITPELVEIAKYAKQHVPTESEMESPEHVKKRVDTMVRLGVISALVSFAKTQSLTNRELISRVVLACSVNPENRGTIVQQGATKAFIGYASLNTPLGKTLISQAFAKIAISINPEISFPGQRMLELVRPLLNLLHQERDALQQYEALLALTNVTSIDDFCRKRILAEKGLTEISSYAFNMDEEEMQVAAIECVLNLIQNEEVLEAYASNEDDRIKLMVLLVCNSECQSTISAAAGALCYLTRNSKACDKILKVNSLFDSIKFLVLNEDLEMQRRAMIIIYNLAVYSKDFAEQVFHSDVKLAINGTAKLNHIFTSPNDKSLRSQIKVLAEDILKLDLQEDDD